MPEPQPPSDWLGDFEKLMRSRDNAQQMPVDYEVLADLNEQLAARKWISPIAKPETK